MPNCDPQVYGARHEGTVAAARRARAAGPRAAHASAGRSIRETYGGSFVYHLNDNRAYVGFVTGLDYRDPRFFPFEAFQQFKHHPAMHAFLQGGEILSAGARTIAAGGWQSMPKLEMPGAVLVGDSAGTLNVPKIKGIHQAMRCGMAAADYFAENDTSIGFDAVWRKTEAVAELHEVRNIKPGFKRGLRFGMLNAGIESLLGGRTPWTLSNVADLAAGEAGRVRIARPPLGEPRPAAARPAVVGVLRRHRARRGAARASQGARPSHLRRPLRRRSTAIPARASARRSVYEMVDDGAGGKRLQINAANCVHCKACDIKDPYQIIDWTTPEGGSGPNYQLL